MKSHEHRPILIEKVLGILPEVRTEGLELDALVLDHGQLQKPHQKATTKGGRTLGISLDKGERLYPLAVLYLDDQVVIYVELAEEDLLEIRPENPLEWGRAAYNVGNMHQTAYLYEDCIRVPYDPVLVRMLDQLGVPWSRKTGRLDGLRANAAMGSGHAHDHDHGHDHDHSHSHEQPHED
jgi:urease accessory protein